MKTFFFSNSNFFNIEEKFYFNHFKVSIKLFKEYNFKDFFYYYIEDGTIQTNIVNPDFTSISSIVKFLKEENIKTVVITKNISPELLYVFKANEIVIICFGYDKDYDEIIDIFIDPLSEQNNRYFSGKRYLLIDALDKSLEDFVEKSYNQKYEDIISELKYFESDIGSIPDIIGLVTKLEWDTEFFGKNVAYLSCLKLTESIAKNVENYCKKEKIDVLEYLCNCHDQKSVRVAEKYGYNFVDIRLTYENKIINFEMPFEIPQGYYVAKGEKKDIDNLKKIASRSYLDSRYYYDSNFPQEKISEYYQSWVEKATLGTFDDYAYVLYHNNNAIGFCTIKIIMEGRARIGLVGLSEKYCSEGLGKQLLIYSLNDLKNNGTTYVQVTTQGRNYAAQRLYQRVGFITKSTELWYHKWF